MNLLETIHGQDFYLIDFYADWCPPCQLQLQQLDSMKDDLPHNVHLIKIDVDNDKLNTIQFDAVYQIMGVPTLMLFHQGKLVWKHSGVKFKEDLMAIIDQHRALYNDAI